MEVNMDNIMSASFGESSQEIRGVYKKTILVKQYETEVTEIESVLKIDKPITGAERMLASAILQAQLEYTAYCNLVYKGQVTQGELSCRKKELEQGVLAIKNKAEAVLGRSLDIWLENTELK